MRYTRPPGNAGSAARFGMPVEGSVIYTTTRPCFGCTKELLQAKVWAVYYLHDWQHPSPQARETYRLIQHRFPRGIKQLRVDDPRAAWAHPHRGLADDSTGHTPG